MRPDPWTRLGSEGSADHAPIRVDVAAFPALRVQTVDPGEEGLGALVAVGAGSMARPLLLVLRHEPRGAPRGPRLGAHVDMLGPALLDEDRGVAVGRGATGYGVRLLIELATRLSSKQRRERRRPGADLVAGPGRAVTGDRRW